MPDAGLTFSIIIILRGVHTPYMNTIRHTALRTNPKLNLGAIISYSRASIIIGCIAPLLCSLYSHSTFLVARLSSDENINNDVTWGETGVGRDFD